uniref:DNA topoisomerase IB n=1 Tax=Ningiella ruwaisensis TaxID=2364274 RepID=UPI00109FA700|nr:DNA topoisomerase IB [Ningiella ruwaisensis]
MDQLIEATPDRMTISRKPYGRGFSYFNAQNQRISCKQTKLRIKQLTIPPMWKDVLISEVDNTHIQAFGYDLKKRKQYIYHELWHLQQQQKKFAKLYDFAKQLKAIRAQIHSDLKREKWDYEKACASALMLLDKTGVRVGNKAYVKENDTYGLTTLRRKHVLEQNNKVQLHFTGKHKVERQIEIDDARLEKLIKTCADLPGYSLFRFYEKGTWKDLDSDDINEYIRRTMGSAFSAKDFRTWHGTCEAARKHKSVIKELNSNTRKKYVPTLVKSVATYLGNTPSVCKLYYIHPSILEALKQAYDDNLDLSLSELPQTQADDGFMDDAERFVFERLANAQS